jgi:hypothetical protein
LSRNNLAWLMLAIIVGITVWWVYGQVTRPHEMQWEILEDLKFRFPVPQVPNPWRR